jgi:hypothetical protein
MSTTPFTPEPLFVKDGSEVIDGGRVGTLDILNREQHEEGYKWIGDVRPYGGTFPDYEEAKAYAKLFAAAPDLLAALKELVECDYTSGTHLYTAQLRAKAAIAKATQ